MGSMEYKPALGHCLQANQHMRDLLLKQQVFEELAAGTFILRSHVAGTPLHLDATAT